MSKSEIVSEKVRDQKFRVFSEQSGLCWWCKEPMVLTDDRTNPRRMELAHRINQGPTNMKLWGEAVIHHRMNVHGCHPGVCNKKASINPGSIQAERLVYDIQKELKKAKDKRYRKW